MKTATEMAMLLTRPRYIAELEREYRATVEPLQKIRARIYAMVMPHITICIDGRMEVVYTFPSHVRGVLDTIDAQIADITNSFNERAAACSSARPP